jgi:hypothetical protein
MLTDIALVRMLLTRPPSPEKFPAPAHDPRFVPIKLPRK